MVRPVQDDRADPRRSRRDLRGRLKVAKINIDHNQKTPRNYNVRGIPTLMIFKDGKVEATQIGAVSKTQLAQLIDRAIAGSRRSIAIAGAGVTRRTRGTERRGGGSPTLPSFDPRERRRDSGAVDARDQRC